ncbi:MAG: hydrogenase maturation nickel metallochaperone HypA [Bacteroidota bacterium]
MHEASIVESLLAFACQHVPDGKRVQRINVRVGVLTGVSTDAMQFYFEIMRENTIGAQAELEISLEPLRAHCEACGSDSKFLELELTCPVCGAEALSYKNGDELDIVSLEVEDGNCYNN